MRQIAARHPDADDVCQDAWLSWLTGVRRSGSLLAPPDRALACHIVRMRAIDRRRTQSRRPAVPLDTRHVDPAVNPPQELVDARDSCERILSRLAPRDRLLLRLRFEYDCACHEIAGIVGGTADSVRRRIRTCLQRLRRTSIVRSLRGSA